MPDRTTNRLAKESSPYLLQHAHNPVDWYPWGPEALATSRDEQKPIFLSVGYSSCHWCHVMEHESFEDNATAQLMNDLFINIKVDREERPDVDEIYMQAVQLFSGGHGGWPMSVFLTPELIPYYAGTYFPPQDRAGMPSFQRILQATAQAWRDKRQTVEQTGQQVVESLQKMTAIPPNDDIPGEELLHTAYGLLQKSYDPQDGGFGNAPKFPHPMDLSFLLRYAQRTGQGQASQMALHTLHRMARGGMFDQLRGGFHRYSTDDKWLVPHFEKMLYDNALMVRTYVEAWLVSRDDFHRHIASRILEYIQHEMTSAEGGFYSAQDADSEGVEGTYFVWTPAEVQSVLPANLARLALAYYDITETGNFENAGSILSVPRDDDIVAKELGLSWNDFQEQLQDVRQRLLEHRQQRVAPATDDKIITAWNGLMISAYARAYQVWRQPEWLQAAERAGRFIQEKSPEFLFRTYRNGSTAGHGFLDDHAAWIAACIDLYEATFADEWLQEALRWTDVVRRDFLDSESGGFFYSGRQHESLIARSRNFLDSATPSGNALQLANLQRLAHLTGKPDLLEQAHRVLRAHARLLRQYPTGMSEMLCGLDFQLGPVTEIVVAGTGGPQLPLLEEVFTNFLPNKVVAGWPNEGRVAPLALLEGRETPDPEAAVFVCQDQTCQAPVHTPAAVREALAAAQLQSR